MQGRACSLSALWLVLHILQSQLTVVLVTKDRSSLEEDLPAWLEGIRAESRSLSGSSFHRHSSRRENSAFSFQHLQAIFRTGADRNLRKSERLPRFSNFISFNRQLDKPSVFTPTSTTRQPGIFWTFGISNRVRGRRAEAAKETESDDFAQNTISYGASTVDQLETSPTVIKPDSRGVRILHQPASRSKRTARLEGDVYGLDRRVLTASLQQTSGEVNDQDDDYLIQSAPAVVNITLDDVLFSTTPFTFPPKAAYTGVPTAAPHQQPAVPTAAPTRQPLPHTTDTVRNGTSTTYAIPTLERQQAVSSTTARSAGLAEYSVRGTFSPAGTVCLQFTSVQHDLDCNYRTRRDVPSTLHLTLLLQHYGGSPSSPFTAASHSEALANFRNLMPLGSSDAGERIHPKFNTHQLQELLEKYYSAKSLQQEDKFQLPSNFLQQMIPASRAKFHTNAQRNRRSSVLIEQHSYVCSNSVSCRDFDNSTCDNGETELALDDNDCETCRCVDPDSINGYCLRASDPHDGSVHAHLCMQCQKTGFLGPDVFPSYIQEVVCHPNSSSCLDIAHHGPQGACQEAHVPITVLHRIPGRCMMVSLSDGQSLLLDDWRMAQQLIRTGCQCMLDKRSQLMTSMTTF